MAVKQSRQRSRKGCLTCRQKRKKCDEVAPTCGRCDRGSEICVWPLSTSSPEQLESNKSLARLTTPVGGSELSSPRTSYVLECTSDKDETTRRLGVNHLVQRSSRNKSNRKTLLGRPNDPEQCSRLGSGVSSLPSVEGIPSELSYTLQPVAGALDCASPTWQFNSRISADDKESNQTRIGYEFDQDEEETFQTVTWFPSAKHSIRTAIFYCDQFCSPSAIESYLEFIVRFCYDPITIPDLTSLVRARVSGSESVRLAVLTTANFCHSFACSPPLSLTLQRRAKVLGEAAGSALQVELARQDVPVTVKLAGINELINYHYCSGDFSGYQICIEQAVSLIKSVLGTTPIRFYKLQGQQTIDVQVIIWYDVVSSIAMCHPTRLVYDYDAEMLLQNNRDGPSRTDVGLEWIAGMPDALLMLTIQIINLRHSQYSPAERTVQAIRIEAALRKWKVWPSSIPNSVMKMQRMGAQEVWKHFVILYLYHAIYGAGPTDPVVRQSVKEIIQLATILKPGRNPDCVLCIPYFLAGTLTVSTRQRQFLKARILGCEMGVYASNLADGLEQIWNNLNGANSHHDWATMLPPIRPML